MIDTLKYYKLLKNEQIIGIVETYLEDRLKDFFPFIKKEISKKEYYFLTLQFKLNGKKN